MGWCHPTWVAPGKLEGQIVVAVHIVVAAEGLVAADCRGHWGWLAWCGWCSRSRGHSCRLSCDYLNLLGIQVGDHTGFSLMVSVLAAVDIEFDRDRLASL